MPAIIEQPATWCPQPRAIWRDFGLVYVLNGVAAFLFSCTGPVAIIISVAVAGGLNETHIASWMFGGFAIGGTLTILFSVAYQQPLSFAWTIPGTVLLGSSLDHLRFDEIVGAYLMTGVVMALLGFSGWVRRAMDFVPMPIVMGMVAGVFLSFGIGLVNAFDEHFAIALPMIAAYLIAAAIPVLGRALPPVVAALIVGAIAVFATDAMQVGGAPPPFSLPQVYLPSFSWQAMIELVVPLAITVLVVQNGQGFAILRAAEHRPPINSMTVACGVGSLFFGLVGSVSACVTGPANAVLASSGETRRQYTAAITYGVLGILFGTFAATMTWLALKLPPAYIATLGGLAILKVLQGAFVTAFSSRFTLGATVTFLVTVSDLTLWNIGAPFWGLVAGFGVSGLLERDDFQVHLQEPGES